MSSENQAFTIDILLNAIRENEATGDHTIALARALQGHAYSVRIFADAVGDLPPAIRSITKRIDAKNYPVDADLVIVQYAIWHPLAEQLRTCKVPSIFYYHGVTPPDFFPDAARQATQRNSRQRAELVHQATLAVCTSPYTAWELSELTGYPIEQIKIIPLPIDIAAFSAPLQPKTLDTLRKQWGVDGKRVLLYVGRIAEHKRIDLLIDALAKLKPAMPNLHLLIVGNTTASTTTRLLYESLQQQALRLNMAASVSFCGAVESAIPYYHLADLYLQPSQHEGFCAPLLEAMAAGVPIVASDAGAMPWLLQAEMGAVQSVGRVFKAGDLEAFVAHIAQLLADADGCIALVERGRKRVQEFSQPHFVENVVRAVEEALRRHSQIQSTHQRHPSALHAMADIALRDYKVRSNLPIIGSWLAWLRRNSTSHLKEPYIDLMIEQQVNYNRQLAKEIDRLQAQVETLQHALEALQSQRSEKNQ